MERTLFTALLFAPLAALHGAASPKPVKVFLGRMPCRAICPAALIFILLRKEMFESFIVLFGFCEWVPVLRRSP